jgi:hypothetical protein
MNTPTPSNSCKSGLFHIIIHCNYKVIYFVLNINLDKFLGIFFRMQKIRPSKIKEQSQIIIMILIIII